MFLALAAIVLGVSAVFRSALDIPLKGKKELAVLELRKRQLKATPQQVLQSVQTGDLRSLNLLGRAGIDFNITDKKGKSALHLAVEKKQPSVIPLLEKYGIAMNKKDNTGETAIAKAAISGQYKLAQELLAKGEEIDFSTAEQKHGLFHFIDENNQSGVEFMLRNGVPADLCDGDGKSALLVSLEQQNLDVFRILLAKGASQESVVDDKLPVLIGLMNGVDRFGISPHQLPELMRDFIKAGADVEAIDPASELSAIELSIVTNQQEVFGLLLDHVSSESISPRLLALAIRHNRLPMVKALLKRGVATKQANADGDTPVMTAVRSDNGAMVQCLLEHGADSDAIAKEGQNALFIALAMKNRSAIIAIIKHAKKLKINEPMKHPVSDEYRELFQKKGVFDWYCRKVKGITPLMAAVMRDDVEVVEAMIKKGAKRFQRSAAKTYPVQMAAMMKNVPMQQLLLGAKHKDKDQERQFIVDLSEQRVYYYKKNKLIKKITCSTGKSGYRTPPGLYVITERTRHKVSNIYKGAKMPFFQRFSSSAIGFHQGNVGSRYASHGCIRLSYSGAKYFWGEAKMGDRVTIRK